MFILVANFEVGRPRSLNYRSRRVVRTPLCDFSHSASISGVQRDWLWTVINTRTLVSRFLCPIMHQVCTPKVSSIKFHLRDFTASHSAYIVSGKFFISKLKKSTCYSSKTERSKEE